MKCKRCGEENGDAKRTCSRCGAFLEGYTLNNVTGEYGYRGADGGWYKSEEEYRAQSSDEHELHELHEFLKGIRTMGLFGLSTSEAILLTRQLNVEQERRKNETLRAINQQQAALEQQSEADRKTQLEAIGQIGTEARQLEPFITMQLVGESFYPIDDTVSIRPSDIREFKRLDASYDTNDYDNPAPFGYYSKTIHRPYTAVILWSTKQINVVDTVEQIQEKIQQNIERLCKIQAQILADAARKED